MDPPTNIVSTFLNQSQLLYTTLTAKFDSVMLAGKIGFCCDEINKHQIFEYDTQKVDVQVLGIDNRAKEISYCFVVKNINPIHANMSCDNCHMEPNYEYQCENCQCKIWFDV